MPGSTRDAPTSGKAREAPEPSALDGTDDCDRCGAELECKRRQPGSTTDLETRHFRCPDCGAGGFRVLRPDGSEERTGGPIFGDNRQSGPSAEV